MKTIAQSLPPDALDALIEELAPADLNQQELVEFKKHLAKQDARQLKNLQAELQSAARTRARRIVLRQQLLDRLGTPWLRRHQEMVEAQLASVEVAKDVTDFNILELELSSQTWRLDRSTRVQHLSERTKNDPLIDLIKRQQGENEIEVLGNDNALDDEKLQSLFELR
jgi:hypothetical protein